MSTTCSALLFLPFIEPTTLHASRSGLRVVVLQETHWQGLTEEDGALHAWNEVLNHIAGLPRLFTSENLPATLRVVPNASYMGHLLPTLSMLNEINDGEIAILPEYLRRIAKLYSVGRAVLITGQPGIGKSMLLIYLFFVLLSLKDEPDPDLGLCSAPVFLYTKDQPILFYNGQIYRPVDLDRETSIKTLLPR
ncbi:hypothetical protein BDP27DRAFT_1365275 [Rhodocollybia butyracea]|uniref:Uncharacterized protein n=1 Tax=Rhodocollybia butyracea TaxID=206335 RepID=A0A9P5PP98_9AGAR|nr:hypothetical protein BDP27DRAFT_1365275 [Rhodocollybia butyracea]